MELKKQLEKIIADLAALEARKEKFFAGYDSQKKKLLQRKKETEEKISQEQKKKILQAIEENFGEITDETMPAFIKAISSTAESWNETSGQEAEENAGDSAAEGNGLTGESNDVWRDGYLS